LLALGRPWHANEHGVSNFQAQHITSVALASIVVTKEVNGSVCRFDERKPSDKEKNLKGGSHIHSTILLSLLLHSSIKDSFLSTSNRKKFL
jgi:hypothetical protein